MRGLETVRIGKERKGDENKKKAPLEESARLLAYLADPAPETVLVLIADDERGGKNWAKKLAGLCETVAFTPLKAGALRGVVRKLADEREIALRPEAVELLLEETGNDLIRIGQELEKIALAVGPGSTAGIDEVHLHVCGYAYQTMFQFVQSVGDRDVKKSMLLAANFFETAKKEDSYMMVGMLARRLRILWYLAEDGSGRRGQVPPTAYRLQEWQLRDYRKQAAGFTRAEVEKLLEDLLRIDSVQKSRSVSFRLLMENFILTLSGVERAAISLR